MANRRVLPVKDGVKIDLRAGGNLYLQGWERQEVGILGYEDDTRVQSDEDAMHISCGSDIDVMVPGQVEVAVEKVGGEAYIRQIQGKLDVQRVGGNLFIQNSANVTIERIGGDCRLQHISSELKVERVSGDLICHDIQCAMAVETVRGDAIIQSVTPPAMVQASGDIALSLTSLSNGEVSMRAKGDLSLFIPKEGNAQLNIESSGREINLNVAGEHRRVKEMTYSFSVGNGEGTIINVKSSGDVIVSDEVSSIGGCENLFQRLDQDWEEFTKGNTEKFQSWQHPFDRASEIADRVSRSVTQRIVERSERKIQAAMEKVEARMRDMDWGFEAPEPPIPPIPPVPPAPFNSTPGPFSRRSAPVEEKVNTTREERLKILEMLSEKKITAEQAADLLRILGRKG
jgi:hypothetical protein